MTDMDYLKEEKEEAEYLRKRTWDLYYSLDKLEAESDKKIDAERWQSLQNQIEKTKKLLEEYTEAYYTLCQEAVIEHEVATVPVPARDIVSVLEKKTFKTEKDLIQKREIGISPFFNTPPENKNFTGREEEVISFIKQIIQGGAFAICGVKGMGGIGKTEIAKEMCHLFKETWNKSPDLPDYVAPLLSEGPFFSDGILWIQFEREHQNPMNLTEYIISQITDPHTAAKIPDLKELANILAKKDILVVFDSVEQNLRTFNYVNDIFKGRFPIIITSRIEIPGIRSIDINVLKDDEAYALFVNHLGNKNTESARQKEIHDLSGILGNFPLAIKIIASRVDQDHSNISDLKESYQKNRTLLLDEKGLGLDMETRNINVKTCFSMSYNDLDEFEKKVFIHTAVFNNPFAASELAALMGDADESEIRDILSKAVRFSLINKLTGKDTQTIKYDLHSLMREFALDLLMQTATVIHGKKEEIELLLEQVTKAEDDNTLSDLLDDEALLEQIADAMKYCDRIFDFATVIQFMDKINEPVHTLAYWDEKIELNALAVRAAVALQNKSSEVFYRLRFADTLQRKGFSKSDLELAAKAFKKALSICSEVKNAGDALFAQYSLAMTEKNLNQFNASVINNYIGIREACKYGNFYWLGAFTRTIGLINNDFFIYKPELFTINFKLKGKKPEEDWQKQNLLTAYDDVIGCQYNLGKTDACLELYNKRLMLSKNLKSKELIANSIHDLFLCYFHLQDIDECKKYLEQYLAITSEMGIPENERQFAKGGFAFLTKDYKTAIQEFSAALSDEYIGQHGVKYWLGKAYLHNDDLKPAEQYLSELLTFYQEQKNPVEVANVYTQLALLELKRNNIRKAAEYITTSIKTKQAYGIEFLREEEAIKQEILAKIEKQDPGSNLYATMEAEAKPLDLKPDFLIEGLPDSVIGKDRKEMILIPEGRAFIGKGEIEDLVTEDILENIETYLYPYKDIKGQYKIPPHPNTVFNEEKFLFLLEKSNSLQSEEKQDIIDKIPELNQQQISQFISLFEKEYDLTNAKATEIYLYPYYIDREAVTNAEYELFCDETGHSCPEHWKDKRIPENADHLPVVNITLEDAEAYAKWAGKEIPTEAEWEKACRGEKGNIYPWGDGWDENQVRSENGEIRKQFESDYNELNITIPEQGGMIRFKTHRFTIPSHDLEFDEALFLSYVEGSVSWTADEKQRVIESVPKLNQAQIDDYYTILEEEKKRSLAFDKEFQGYYNTIRKDRYMELMQPELTELYISALNEPGENVSPYGVCNMAGNIYEITVSEDSGNYIVKGGSWFSENPEQSSAAWAGEKIKVREKRMDVGFRCVKPVYSKDDISEK